MAPILQIQNLGKRFGSLVALEDITFGVEKGERFALLGPNGAGKTTLVRILSTLARPSSGTVRIGGLNIAEEPEAVKRMIGVVSHNTFLYDELTAAENLEFYSELYDADPSGIEASLRRAGLLERSEDIVATFSRGMKQRLAIAKALLHNPDILLLDEASAGLDVQGRMSLYATLRELNAVGKTLFLTTHQIGEAEELCEKVAIVHRGRLKAVGSLKEIKGEYRSLEEAYLGLTGG